MEIGVDGSGWDAAPFAAQDNPLPAAPQGKPADHPHAEEAVHGLGVRCFLGFLRV
jgi:hypothetical protein